jgi:hypothetical protein
LIDLEGASLAELVLAEPAGLDSEAADARGPGSLDVPDAVADGERMAGIDAGCLLLVTLRPSSGLP